MPARSLDTVPAPRAVFVTGAPGSGKSTVGALLARRLGAALLDLDTATTSLTAIIGDLHGTTNLDDANLASLTRGARYEAIVALAEDNLAAGLSVVLVAPFTTERRDPQAWSALRRRMTAAGGQSVLVWLRIPADEVVRRVEQRGAGRDLDKLAGNWTDRLDLDPPRVPHLEVDALLHPETVAEDIVSRLPDQSLD